MAKLYFRNSRGNEELCTIGEIDEGNVVSEINKDLAKRNPKYKMPYTRVWRNDAGELWVDVGSHTEFYILKEDKVKDGNVES